MLTLRGAEVLAGADVVVYDRLSVGAVLDMAPAEAERVNVGKLPGQPRMPQEEINQLLVEHGLAGRNVVRLKGGDPLVFARGGEEAAALAAAGVDFEIIPGITSAFAAPAYAGIPVTLRHSSTSVTVITGHEAPEIGASDAGVRNAEGGGDLPAGNSDRHEAQDTAAAIEDTPDDGAVLSRSSVNWEAAAELGGTLVILMGVARWDFIAERLLAAGMSPDTPAAAVCWGTRPNQRTTRASLATLGEHDLEAPSVIVVGEVATEELEWFETRPLFGKRVVVTRPANQQSSYSDTPANQQPSLSYSSANQGSSLGDMLASFGRTAGQRNQNLSLGDMLARAGAQPVSVPLIEIVEAADGGAALLDAAGRLGDYDWVILTSANGARALLAAINDARDFGKAKVAAIGPATAEVLTAANVRPDLVPSSYIAEALLEELLGAAASIAPSVAAGKGLASAANGETAMGEPSKQRDSDAVKMDDAQVGEAAMGGTPRPRALIARAAVARDVLPEGLREAGWEVDVVEAYRTEGVEVSEASRTEIANSDVITFASPSAVEQFAKVGLVAEVTIAEGKTGVESKTDTDGPNPPNPIAPRPNPIVACIGPITADAARRFSLEVAVEAAEHTASGLVAALEDYFANPD